MKPYYLIGEHLGHSFSAEIHRAFGRYDYELKELSPAALGPFLKRRDFAGVNVTIPYKEAVIPFLDHLDPSAAAIGAVNTVVNRDGVLWGYNTDFGGMKASLECLCLRRADDGRPCGEQASPVRQALLLEKTVLLLGTGGSSKTALAVCRALGASVIDRVSRTGREGALRYEELEQNGLRPDLIINCTPVGMWPDTDGLPLDLKAFGFCPSGRSEGPASRRSRESASHVPCPPPSAGPAVFDCVYNPLRTRLVVEAQDLGLPAAGGLYMLVKQAALACERFTGTPVPEAQVDALCNSLRRERENLVLIGMPGAGKSTVGRILAQKCGKKFVDVDEEIEARAGTSISAIFAASGEARFRDLEAAAVREVAACSGTVVATGGGTVLLAENLRRLRQTGRLILLDQPLDALLPAPERPLGDTAEKLAALYAARAPLYTAAAELRIDNSGTPEQAAAAILDAIS